MKTRWLRTLACLGLLGGSALGCKVYEKPSGDASSGGGGGNTAGMSGSGGGTPQPCVPSTEVCNARDDDCNDVVDDEEPASEDCSERYHANVTCGRGGFCLFFSSNPMCHPGWYHCDGMPQTGCESNVPCCPTCVDAGPDDESGADDAGQQ